MAFRSSVTALGITDHDTFSSCDITRTRGRRAGFELICGIRLSTASCMAQSVRLLGYFLPTDRLGEFRSWICELQTARREHNIRLVARLQELGMDITLALTEARGRGMTGRPHFAQLLVEKGYVPDLRQAFDQYLDESAKVTCFAANPPSPRAWKWIHDYLRSGISSLAHPIRVRCDVAALMPELCGNGLTAIRKPITATTRRKIRRSIWLWPSYAACRLPAVRIFHGAREAGRKSGHRLQGNLRFTPDLLTRLRTAQAAG